jgi:molybdenum cofactor synthesis domain-containing protein
VAVLSTGAEVADGYVRDTNWATITGVLTPDGFACEQRGTVRDDAELIAGSIRMCVEAGFGLVVTTGGVGAEDKDRTVEAVQLLDPGAHTPYLCRFEAGHGRHVKDGVRIAVGGFRGARIVSLPGPNDEVTVAVAVLRDGLTAGWPPATLAEALAEALRQVLRDRMASRPRHGHGHGMHIPSGGDR